MPCIQWTPVSFSSLQILNHVLLCFGYSRNDSVFVLLHHLHFWEFLAENDYCWSTEELDQLENYQYQKFGATIVLRILVVVTFYLDVGRRIYNRPAYQFNSHFFVPNE